ncbi:OsmC family protein [Actinotalea sp. Marseille-Q4924]|uniref:OsmC family protein n=1 Tax=Actinotalea sp. Marseille-Q4924 TaxID=2866571 RepID=UPI001CE3FE2D|nr:OsmC family protein [Actinotalea sp. Marseille-Q4924]
MTTTTSSSTRLAEERTEQLTAVIAGTAEAVAADPTRAAVQFTVTGASTGSVATDVQARQHTFVVDEPASLGGDDSATNPVEYALGSLIGCQVVTYRFWATRLGIRLDDVQVSAVGDLDVRGFFGLDEAVRPGFGEIRLDVRLTGPETPERYAELHAAVDAHCPVLDLFTNATPVTTSLVTEG